MLILTDEQKVSLSIEPRTAAGNVARVDGVPTWTVSNAEVLQLQVADDGMSAVAFSVALGDCQVIVTADADLDETEVREITNFLDVSVIAAEAIGLGIVAGTPEVK